MMFEVGDRVKAKIDMVSDLRDAGMGVELCARQGDILVIRRVTNYARLAVSHEQVTDRAFIAGPEEIEPIAQQETPND